MREDIDPNSTESVNEEAAEPSIERFPSVVLAGPGCFCLLFVVTAQASGMGLFVSAIAAALSALFFGIVAARTKTDQARTVWAILAFLGPVLFCLTLMSTL